MKNLTKNINDSQVIAEKEEYIKELFDKKDTTIIENAQKNSIIRNLLILDNKYVKKEEIINSCISVIRENVRDIHFLSDEIAFIEECDKDNDIYYRPVINGKVTNMAFDTLDKALIGFLACKYEAEDFGYKAITAMLGIED